MEALPPWPYPLWIAHRGAGKLAPENTLAAFRVGLALGYQMAECDVTLSGDGVPFLLHDARLERTTNGFGLARLQPWSAMAQLNAGRWHGTEFATEPLPTLAALAGLARETGLMLNLELKPGPEDDARCGRIAATEAQRLWASIETPPPLLSSFSIEALAAARDHAPALPRALLLERVSDGWRDAARELGAVAVVIEHRAVDAEVVLQALESGLRVLCYTVNGEAEARRLEDAGVDGLITDAIDRLGPQALP
ncbi:glycerophosphodiester phosphodiesterase [Rivibacter subsaxonicus]|nr:glycerophosphodiester phosphodiesterase [Rivibacter subsaxonicus]